MEDYGPHIRELQRYQSVENSPYAEALRLTASMLKRP